VQATPGKGTAEYQGYTCDNCGERAQIQNKYILQMPNVYTIGLQWLQNVEIENDKLGRFKDEVDKKDIAAVLRLIPSQLDLSDFYQTQQSDLGNPTPKSSTPGSSRFNRTPSGQTPSDDI